MGRRLARLADRSNKSERNGSLIGGPANQSATFNKANLIDAFTFDSQLNQTSSDYAVGSVAGTDSYDYENHLVTRTPTGSSSPSITIDYDVEGNRVKKTTAAGTVYFLTDDLTPTGYSQVVEARTLSGTTWSLQSRWIYGDKVISQSDSSGLNWYYGFDGHNNVRVLFNASGTAVGSKTYDGFGIEWGETMPSSNPYRYVSVQPTTVYSK